MDKTAPLYAYLRKSSKQDEKQAPSIPRQRAELLAYARREGLRIGREFIERESAKSTGRPVFSEMIRRIEAGEASGIVTWHPDRLARNAVDGGRIIDLLDKRKLLLLKFASFWFENNPQGRFMLMMAFAQSAHYVDALSVNTKSGLNRKVARGEFPGRARVGYLNDRRKKRIVIDRERAPVIREAFERYATGSDTIDEVSDFLFSRGIGSGREDNLRPMIRPRIGKILFDPLYYGHFRYNGEVHRGIHEPIISKELFDRVQAVRTRRVRFHPYAKALKPFAYRRTLSCATCGGAITAESQKGHTYYRCSRKSKRVARCTEPYIREEALDLQLIELLKPYSLCSQWADEMLSRIEGERATATEQAQTLIEVNCLKIDTINASLITLQDGLVDGLFDHEYVRTKRTALMGTRRDLEAKNDELSNDATSWLEPFRDFISTARNIALTCSHGTKEARAELARKIFGSNLVLSSRKPRGEAVKPWAIFADNELSHDLVPLYDAARTYFQSYLSANRPQGQ
jgi:site-specific DNA recombinase